MTSSTKLESFARLPLGTRVQRYNQNLHSRKPESLSVVVFPILRAYVPLCFHHKIKFMTPTPENPCWRRLRALQL